MKNTITITKTTTTTIETEVQLPAFFKNDTDYYAVTGKTTSYPSGTKVYYNPPYASIYAGLFSLPADAIQITAQEFAGMYGAAFSIVNGRFQALSKEVQP